MAKLTDITEISNPLLDDDLIHVVDTKDSTQDPAGSSFKLRLITLVNWIATKLDFSLANVLSKGNITAGVNILIENTDAVELKNGSLLKKGTYDFGGGGGISQICSIGYEENWQAGIRHVFDTSGNIRESSNCFNIIPDNTFDDTLRFKSGSRWVLDNGDVYVCSDASTGAAVWDLYSNQVNADWNATSGVAEILNKPTIGTGDMLKSTYDVDNTGIVDNAEAIKIIGRNSTGATLYPGTVVYLNGATGNRPNFAKAKADAESTSAGTFGVIVDAIANNADGYCIALGYLDNLDTRSTATNPFTSDTLAAGDTIYLSPTTAGYITNVKPSAPNHLVYLGKVTRTSPTNGTIVYRIQNGYELEELHNVAIASVANNDILQYETSTSLWKNKAIPTATSSVNGYLSSTDWTTFNAKVTANSAITGATKTKITYDTKGLVTSGADATTADIADSTNKRYVTDANLTVIGNTSGTNTGDQTFLNARVQSVTSSATVTPTSTNDLVKITAQAAGLTIANPTGTMTEGQSLMIRIKDNGTAQTIAFGTNYRAIGITLPTTTVISKTLYLGLIWNDTDTKFDVIGISQQA